MKIPIIGKDFRKIIILICFLLLASYFRKTMFIETDAFNSQIRSVVTGVNYSLKKIHIVRFITVFPFYIFKNNFFMQALIMYFYTRVIIKEKRVFTYTLIILFILFFSYRTSICSLALPYYELYKKEHKKKYLLLAMLFSTLSSATVLIIILVFITDNYKELLKKVHYLSLILLFFIPSFIHKIYFFTDNGKNSYFQTMYDRSFLIQAILAKDYTRLTIVAFMILIFLYEILRAILVKIDRRFFLSTLPIIFLFIEGLGLYSYMIEKILLLDKILFLNNNKDKSIMRGKIK